MRHEAEYFIPTEYHNPMELFASTAMWDGGGKLTVYDKTQGVQNVQKYLCGVFQKKSDQIKVLSPYRRRGRRRPGAEHQVVLAVMGAEVEPLGAGGADALATYGLEDVRDDRALVLGASKDGTLASTTHQADRDDLPVEDFSRNGYRLVSAV